MKLYTGASLLGSIKLEFESLPPYTKNFSGARTPPLVIQENSSDADRRKPSKAPFMNLYPSFLSALLETGGKIYGIDFIIATHKGSMAYKNWWGSFRESAIIALMNTGERAVEPLITALNYQNEEVRLFAIEVLGKLKDPRAVEPLIPVLNDKNVDVRMLAAEVLGEMGDPRAVEFLTNSLRDKKPEVRLKVAEIFGELKDPRTAVSLIESLEDKNNKVQAAAAYALGQMKEPRAVRTLIFMLETKSSNLREAVISALSEYDDTLTIELLIAAMNDESGKSVHDWNRRTCAAWALGRMDDPRVVEPLIDGLINGKNKAVKLNIAQKALGVMSDPLAVELLIAALKDVEKEDRVHITVALQLITKQRFGNNIEEWEPWWKENKENFAKQKEEEELEGTIGKIKK